MATKSHKTRLERINWYVMLGFILILIAACAGIYLQQSKKIDKNELTDNLEQIENTVQESILVSQHKDRVLSSYYDSHLEDLEEKMKDTQNSLEKKQYDPSLQSIREKTITHADEVSELIHELVRASDDPPSKREKIIDDLKQLSEQVEKLHKSL